MNEEKKVTSILKDYLGKEGIISLDVGTIVEGTGEWKVIEGYCEPSVAWLHSLVSEKFRRGLKKYGIKEPINYIYDYWKDRNDEKDIIIYSFSSNGYIRDIDSIISDENNVSYRLEDKKTSQKKDFKISSSADEINCILDDIIKTVNAPQDDNLLDTFIRYQEIYTNMVLVSFN